jgi:hypothetical protein
MHPGAAPLITTRMLKHELAQHEFKRKLSSAIASQPRLGDIVADVDLTRISPSGARTR